MYVFALTILKLSDHAVLIKPPHLLVVDEVGIVLCKEIDLPALFDSPCQRNTLTQGLASASLAHYVQTCFQGLDCERCVLVEVVRKNDCVHVMLEERVVVSIGLGPNLTCGICQYLLVGIA